MSNMYGKYFIDPIEGQKIILEWIGSDEYKKIFENTSCNQSQDFKSGAMWGAVMASMLISTKATQYHVSGQSREELADDVKNKMTEMCGCLNCIENIRMIIQDNVVPFDSKCQECNRHKECASKLNDSKNDDVEELSKMYDNHIRSLEK